MPMKPLRPCKHPGCPELTKGSYCDRHSSLVTNKRESATERGYDSRWRTASKRYLRSNPLCVHCLENSKMVKATVVDHIVPHRGDKVLFWDESNWQALENMMTRELNDLEDILICCVDGLTGFPDAIRAVFPKAEVQLCIIHQIRNSLKYIASKEQKEFMKDLKLVYKAASEPIALGELDHLTAKWGKKYTVVLDSWLNKWTDLSTYFNYPPDVRRI